MAYSKDKKDKVRKSYIEDALTLTAAAEKHGVAYSAAIRWKKEAVKNSNDNWDDLKAANAITNQGATQHNTKIINQLTPLYEKCLDQLKREDISPDDKAAIMAKMADAYQKTIKACGFVDPQLYKYSVALEVVNILVAIVNNKKGKLSTAIQQELVNILDAVKVEVIKKFGAK